MDSAIQILVAVIVVAIVFLLMRRFVWWYWGIDKHLSNQQEIIDAIKSQIELQQIIADQEARRHQPEPETTKAQPVQRRNPLTG